MTIDEAISILSYKKREETIYGDVELKWALSLGIKALDRIKQGRQKGIDSLKHMLPGETEE